MTEKFDADAFGEAVKAAITEELGSFDPTPREVLMGCAAAMVSIAHVFAESTVEDLAAMLSAEGQKATIDHLRELAKEIEK